MKVNELKFCEVSQKNFQTDAKSFSFLSSKTKEFYYKKHHLGRSLLIGQESSNRWRFAIPIFSKGFD